MEIYLFLLHNFYCIILYFVKHKNIRTTINKIGFTCVYNLFQYDILLMTNVNILIFRGIWNDFNETLDLGFTAERHAEQFNCGVVDVVVGGNHAQVQWRYVHVVFNVDALFSKQVAKYLVVG